MTFSGLPSLRDPKHSLKNSNSGSSASSSPSNSPRSSPTTKPVSGQQQLQQQLQQQQQHQQQQGGAAHLGTADHSTVNVAPPSTATTSIAEVVRPVVTGSSSGAAMMSVAVPNGSTETTSIPTSLIESSFQGLIQSSFGHVLSSLPPQGMVVSQSSTSSPSTADLHQLQVQSPSPASMPLPPMTASPTPIVIKKKATPQNLSLAHSAAYRKRLNVNQVCDWCRYRKIRCDRESPCNSCQHSKRECIRTPPSALLANQQQTPTEEQEPSVSSPASSSGKMKRARAINKDGRSRRASKSYRGSSISSHHSSSYTSFSSDNDGSDEEDEDEGEDEQKSTSGSRAGESSVSPVVGSLTLAGLGLSSLGMGLGGLGSNLGLDARPGSDFQMASPPSFGSSMAAFQESAMPQQMSLQDQEHLERMQRIEMLLSNVIPGAAEFIASGSQGSLHVQQQHHQQLMQQQRRASVVEKKGLSLLTHNLDLHEQQSQHDRILSPQERLAKMALSSPAINTTMTMPWSSSPSLSSLREENEPAETSQSSSSSSSLPLMSGPDYIERMKRIEMLLGTIQDVPLAKALISQSQGQTLSSGSSRSNSVDVVDNNLLPKKASKRDLKKQGRGDGKKSNYNSDGTIIKRPHVAAGFAGQKPPPKLPQAIAEAAQKKQATRKKRVSAAAAAKAAAAAAAAASATAGTTATGSGSETNNTSSLLSSVSMPMGGSSLNTVQGADGIKMDSRIMTISTTASLEIPSTFDNESTSSSSFEHQQQQQQQQQLHQQRMLNIQQQQQHQHQLQMAQHRNSISFQSQSQLFNPYQQQQQQQQQLPMSGVSSLNIPIADSMSSYGSLVVPASSSTSSSPSSSPNISRATAIDQDNSMGMSGQQHLQPQQQNISFPQTQLSGDFEMGFDMRQGMSSGAVLQATNDTHIHRFAHSGQQQQQQQHQHRSNQIDQDGFTDFGLNMDESLEGLMKKSMGSFDRLMESFSSDSPSLLEHHHHQLHQQQQQQQVLTPSTPAASVDQFSYFQNLQQTPTPQQQHFQQQQQQQFLHNQQQQGQQQQQQGHMSFQEMMSRTMWMPNHSGGAASFSVPTNPEFSWSSPPPHPQTPSQAQPQQQQSTIQSINISANDSPQEELELELGLENHQVVQQQQQQLSAHALFQQQHQEQQRRHMEQQQQQQHRASIQHQHQQTFYIPQMQDDEDDEDESNGGLPDHV